MAFRKFPTTVKKKKGKDGSKSTKGFFVVEKRENLRFSVELPLDYSFTDIEETRGGISADASEGGLLVHLHRRIEIGSLLRIEILFVKGFQLDTIEGIARVVWSDLAARERFGEYWYGLQFQSFQEGDLDKLKILLKKVGQSHEDKDKDIPG